jgi:radical SAM/Cys-rich protein
VTCLAQTVAADAVFPRVQRQQLHTLQVNLGYRCNQACSHCHVDAGPTRSETMDRETLDIVLEFLVNNRLRTLDLTGGAPELNRYFRDAVRTARAAGVEVIDRCNLTILNEPGQEDLATFLGAEGVHVMASLPCYSASNVDDQRGKGVYRSSLEGMRKLNQAGYATPGSALELDLVYNPQGSNLPPDPEGLEADYKRELARQGVTFNRLLTITNMPINRFRRALERGGELRAYMDMLITHFEPDNLSRLMCRSLLSVDWRGYVYDCDFNQMLGIPAGGKRRHLSELLVTSLDDATIAVADHCFACTAGRGSSCGGALRG